MPVKFDKANQPYRNYELVGYQNEDYENALADEVEMAAAFEEYQKKGSGGYGEFVDGKFEFRDGRRTVFPVQAFEMTLAMERAVDQIEQMSIPASMDVLEKYPHIDPAGHYSEVDMDMSDRLLRIRAAAELATFENKEFAMKALEAIAGKPAGNPFYTAFRDMRSESQHVRQMDRARELVRTEDGFETLSAERDAIIEKRVTIQVCDGMLKGLEAVVGLRKEPLAEIVTHQFEHALKAPITENLLENAQRRSSGPAAMAVNFGNFDNLSVAVNAVKPENWGKNFRDIPKEMTPEDSQKFMQKYASKTLDTHLSAVYDGMESKIKGNAALTPNRASLITVDGKTVKEMITERYAEMQKSKGQRVEPEAFSEFYNKNYKDLTNEFVSAGMMAGKRVEMFVLDPETDTISRNPTQLVKQGFEPSPVQKVTMNAWERFFSRRGFYKEKTAEFNEYRRIMDSRERVQNGFAIDMGNEHAGAADQVKDAFFKEGLAERGVTQYSDMGEILGLHESFHTTRGSASTACQCRLLHEGYDPRDIYDNTKLLAEKSAMGKEYLNHMMADDKAWLAESFVLGQAAGHKHMKQIMGEVEYNSIFAMGTRSQVLRDISATCFDASQEMSTLRPQCIDATMKHNPGMNAAEAKNHYTRIDDSINTVASYGDALLDTAKARNTLTKDNPTPRELDHALNMILHEKLRNKDMADYREKNGNPLLMDIPFDLVLRTETSAMQNLLDMQRDMEKLDTDSRIRMIRSMDHPDFFEKSGYKMSYKDMGHGMILPCVDTSDKKKIGSFMEGIAKKEEHVQRATEKSEQGLAKDAEKAAAKQNKQQQSPARKK